MKEHKIICSEQYNAMHRVRWCEERMDLEVCANLMHICELRANQNLHLLENEDRIDMKFGNP